MKTISTLLAREPARDGPALTLLPGAEGLSLPLARLHEACGPARHRFALWLAARTSGPVIWISPDWQSETLNPAGFSHLIAPGRLVFVRARRPEDILWCLEETMRAGAVALAVADLPGLPGLTPVRRVHLAAETGAAQGNGVMPLGLLLTPGEGGAQGIETRWHLAPHHAEHPGRWRLSRLRARKASPAAWDLRSQPGQALPRVEGPLPAFA